MYLQAASTCQIFYNYIILTDKRKATVKFRHVLPVNSQTRAVQAYRYQNLESSLVVILICRFCLSCMLAYKHVYNLIDVPI